MQKDNLLKHSSIMFISIIIANILAYVFHFYVGRVLGPAEYGTFSTLVSIMTLLSLPSTAIGLAIAKFTARFISEKKFKEAGFLRNKMQNGVFIFGVILLLFIVMLSQNIADYLKINSNIPVIIMGFSLIFALLSPINRGILQGLKKFKVYSWNGIFEAGIRLVLVIVLLLFGFGVSGSLFAYGLAYGVAFFAIFPFIKETEKNRKEFKLNPVYRFALLVFFVTLITQLLINAPTIFIKHFFSAEFTGYWNAALNLARVSLFIIGGISLVMFPGVAESKDRTEHKFLFRKALFLTLVVSLLIAISFLFLGKLAISILYGSAYFPAITILNYMGFAMILISILQLYVSYWLARKS